MRLSAGTSLYFLQRAMELTGLEPATSPLRRRALCQLSYSPGRPIGRELGFWTGSRPWHAGLISRAEDRPNDLTEAQLVYVSMMAWQWGKKSSTLG